MKILVKLYLTVMFLGCTMLPPVFAQAHAATIVVEDNDNCNLDEAIESHNEKKDIARCTAGDGNDTIKLNPNHLDGTYRVPALVSRPAIKNGILTIVTNLSDHGCIPLVGPSYLKVEQGATLILQGIGDEPDRNALIFGSEAKAVIENHGQLVIEPFIDTTTNPTTVGSPCVFSNNRIRTLSNERSAKGGVIFNTDNGEVHLEGAKLTNSEADNGGAIYNDFGSINISDLDNGKKLAAIANEITVNSADHGGAIYNSSRGTIMIDANNFTISSNTSGREGGAIFNNGGVLTITRQPQTPNKETHFNGSGLSRNAAIFGGAIFSEGGSVNLARMVLTLNTAQNEGGALYLHGVKGAIVADAFIANNSAGIQGGAIYNIAGSTLKVSGCTIEDTRNAGNSGGIYSDGERVEVINSTFLGPGSARGHSIFSVASGNAELEDSTLVNADIGGSSPLAVSNSILSDVNCTNVTDAGYNMQFFGFGCVGTIAVPKLDPNLLQDNGGPTPTIKELPDSPTIDAIPYGNCIDQSGQHVTTDQRGFPRPDPEDGPSGPCDIGAYEYQGSQ